LKLDTDKCPICLDKFGNTSSVSIPLTIASQLQNELKGEKKKLLLCGFGVGMSWATAVIDSPGMAISDLVEVE
jgi:3-oxoacyl-[acyl-carrier-protein] synthase-3